MFCFYHPNCRETEKFSCPEMLQSPSQIPACNPGDFLAVRENTVAKKSKNHLMTY